MADEKYFKLKTAAAEAGVTEATLRYAIVHGTLVASSVPGAKGGYTYMIKESDLLAWVDDRKTVKVEKAEVTLSLKHATVEQLAEEIHRRIKDSYDEGVRVGAKQKAAELKMVLKQGGF